MAKQSNVAAVVVTYNRLELLRQCAQALRNPSAAYDILIMDNIDGIKPVIK